MGVVKMVIVNKGVAVIKDVVLGAGLATSPSTPPPYFFGWLAIHSKARAAMRLKSRRLLVPNEGECFHSSPSR